MKYSFFQRVASRLGYGLDQALVGTAFDHCPPGHIVDEEEVRRALSQIIESAPVTEVRKGTPKTGEMRRVQAKSIRERMMAGAIDDAFLEQAKHLATFVVDDLSTFSVYKFAFQRRYASQLSAISSAVGDWCVLHMTCVARLDRARESVASFRLLEPEVSQLLVVGGGSNSGYQFDLAERVLSVPVPDTYEFLPQKMALAFSILANIGGLRGVLKVDDDHRLKDRDALLRCLRKVAGSRHGQLGTVIRARHFGDHSRAWHMGKCADADLSARPYQSFGTLKWCDGGSGYFVNRHGLRAAEWTSLYFSDFMNRALYEDMLMAEIISRFGGGFGAVDMPRVVDVTSQY